MSHNSQEHNRFLAACGVSRGASLSKKNEKMSQEVKKEPFAAFFIESSLQAETNVVLFTNYQRYLNGQKYEAKLFPMRDA